MGSREFLSFQLVDEESKIEPTTIAVMKHIMRLFPVMLPKNYHKGVKVFPALLAGFCCPSNDYISLVMSNNKCTEHFHLITTKHYAREREWDKTVSSSIPPTLTSPPPPSESLVKYVKITFIFADGNLSLEVIDQTTETLEVNAKFANLLSREALSMPYTLNRVCLFAELHE